MSITRKNLSVCYTDLKTNQVLFLWTTPCSENTKTFGLFFVYLLAKTIAVGRIRTRDLPLKARVEYIFTFDGPPEPQKNIWLRSYTWLGNTRVLRPI